MQVVRFHQGKPTRYSGRVCTMTTYHFDKRPMGKRVVVTRWHDSGDMALRVIVGDGRTDNFRELSSESWSHQQAADVDFQAQAMLLADVYFKGAAA